MHLFERRASARRASDFDAGRLHNAPAANRRQTDRRVSAVRRTMTIKHLEAVHAAGVETLVVRKATYVFNGPYFAWLAEVQSDVGVGFLAGAGSFENDASDPMTAVIESIRAKIFEWDAVLRTLDPGAGTAAP